MYLSVYPCFFVNKSFPDLFITAVIKILIGILIIIHFVGWCCFCSDNISFFIVGINIIISVCF